MKPKISIICPTHKRSQRQKIFAESVMSNCSDPSAIEIIFGIDNNDEEAIATFFEISKIYGKDVIQLCLFPPNEKMSNFANLCYKVASGEIIGNFADDVVFRSKDWDVVVRSCFDAVEDKILLLWSDDGIWGGQLASHTFLHKNWVETLGYINAPYFHTAWTDKWSQEVAESIGRGCAILDRNILFLEHMHASVGKMEIDETSRKSARISVEHNDLDTYTSQEMREKRNSDINKLQKFIEEFHAKKISSNFV